MKNLRIIFMGTPEFAAHNLKCLFESNVATIVAVVTAPDKPAGRGQKLTPSAVKVTATELGIPVLQPEKLKDPGFLAELESFNADLQVVVAFRMLPEVVWNMPPMGSFNLHASLLPQYRGAAPINWAVINGESETGVTTFFLTHEIDTGNVILQKRIAIGDDDDAGTVHDKLMTLGATLVVDTVKAIASENVSVSPQSTLSDEVSLKPAPKIFKEDCKINWDKNVVTVHNLIRGLSPYPASWTEIFEPNGQGVILKIFKSQPMEHIKNLKPGEIMCDGKTELVIGTGDYGLKIVEMQLAGKKRMSVADFLKGYRWQSGTYVK